MGKRLLKLMCILLLLSASLQAAPITRERAMEMASSFYRQEMSKGLRSSETPNLSLAYQATSALRSADGNAYFYVFNVEGDKGFVIVSADDRTYPVLGYSNQGSFDYDRIPDALKDLLAKYEKEMHLLTVQKATSPAGIAEEWNRIGEGTMPINTKASKELTTVDWNQDSPYNSKCPNRRLVGCVGTAMAIIMKYHEWPVKGTGSHEYKGNSATFDVEYNWTGMRSANYDAISTLVYHAAISIDTEFGLYSSSSRENRVPLALTSYFGYDRGVEHKKKERMNDQDWENIIIREIEAGRPVLYVGQDASAGHAFVCDGYKMVGFSNRFHINWGWGGYLNGYFSLSLLNPKTYNYSSMEAMVYNIKPAAGSTAFSPLQLTSEEKQVGVTSDKETIIKNESFSVWAGAIKNTTYEAFSGRIGVVLVDKDEKVKEVVSDPSDLTLQSLEYRLSWQFNNCKVKSASIEEGDQIRLATRTEQEDWKLISGSLSTAESVKATGNRINYFQISFPKSVTNQVTIQQGGNIIQTGQVIQGRNYAFNIIPKNANDVVYVKANGYRLTPDEKEQTLYTLNTVVDNKQIEITVIGADQVKLNKTLWIEAGELERALSNEELGTVKNLTIFGKMDSRDFATIKNKMKLTTLDMSTVTIVANGSNPAHAIPLQALEGCVSLESILLPQNITKICHNAFADNSKLKEIVLPASLVTYEFNLFYYCSSLRKVTVLNRSPKFINWCVFLGTPAERTLVVPNGTIEAYKNAENWKKFGRFEEAPVNPVPDSCKVILQEIAGLNILPVTKVEGEKVAPGTNYEFRTEAESDFADHKLTVYANNTVLKADQNGVYTISNIRQSTMVHVAMEAPEKVGNSPFTVTGVGMISEVTNVMPGKNFSVVVKEIKIPKNEYEYDKFANISIALTDKDGRIKEILSPQVKACAAGSYTYTFNCVVKESSVLASNQLRVVSNTGSWDWTLLKGESNAIDHLQAVGNEVAYYSINMPQKLEKAALENVSDRVVKGMDYSFRVRPYNSTDKIEVRVNGTSLSPVSGDPTLFSIIRVTNDLNITIQVYDLNSEPFTTVNITPGGLKEALANLDVKGKLRIVGKMDTTDFNAIKSVNPIYLDLSDVEIVAYNSYGANTIPKNAFAVPGITSITNLKSIVLPNSLVEIEASAFYRCFELTEISIPEKVRKIGVQAFFYNNKLTKITVKWKMIPSLNNLTNIFPNDKHNIKLAVPLGCSSLYKKAETWKDFKIEEITECYSSSFPVISGISFLAIGSIDLDKIEEGSNFSFRVTVDNSFAGKYFDITVNDSIYKPVDGLYSIKNVHSNIKVGVIVYHSVTYTRPEGSTVDIEILPMPGLSLDSVKAGSDCLFIVRATKAILDNLKVKANDTDLQSPDSIYKVPNILANQKLTIFVQVPDNKGDGLDAGILDAIETSEADTLKTLSVTGNITDFEILKKFSAVESLDLSDLVNEEIPIKAFAEMTSLRTIELPAGLREIGDKAFVGCSNLESLVMKPSLEKVGNSVFAGCTNLTSIVFTSPTVEFAEETFENVNPNCIILKMSTDDPNGVPQEIQSKSLAVTENPNRVLLAVSTINGYLVDNLSQDIVLTDKCTFSSPARIKLAPGKYITFTRKFDVVTRTGETTEKVSNWETISLPFHVGKVMSDNKVLEVGKDYQLQKLTKEGFVQAASIERDVPYLISAEGILTFSSVEEDSILVTPEDWTATKGDVFNMKPTYSVVNKEDTVYAVNETVFRSNWRDIEPFEAYVVMVGGEAEYDIVVAENPGVDPEIPETPLDPEIPTDIARPVSGDMQMQVTNGELVIQSPKEDILLIYSFDGRMIHRVKLNVGSNRVHLPGGTYIVGRKKISL